MCTVFERKTVSIFDALSLERNWIYHNVTILIKWTPSLSPSPTIFSCWPVTITYLSAFDSLKLGKALYLSNSLTASKCPDAQLQCSAVIPSLSWWSTSAPCSINTVINFTNPPWAAHCSGVRLQNTQTNRYARALKRFPGLEPRPLVYRNFHVITDEKV